MRSSSAASGLWVSAGKMAMWLAAPMSVASLSRLAYARRCSGRLMRPWESIDDWAIQGHTQTTKKRKQMTLRDLLLVGEVALAVGVTGAIQDRQIPPPLDSAMSAMSRILSRRTGILLIRGLPDRIFILIIGALASRKDASTGSEVKHRKPSRLGRMNK